MLIQIGEILEHQSCYELCFDVEATATTNDPAFFLYRCNESYEIQIYSSGWRVCTDLGPILLNFFYHQLVPDWKKAPQVVCFSPR